MAAGHKDLEETLSTLDYAHRATNIQNKPKINQRLTKKAVLKEYTEKIDKLRRDLEAVREKNDVFLATEEYADMVYKIGSSNKEMTEMSERNKALKEERAGKQIALFNEVSYNLVQHNEEINQLESKLKWTEQDLEMKKRNLRKAKHCYEEKKAIITQHMKSEELLTRQAQELISTAELAASNTKKLHETIDRHSQLDLQLESSCDSFAGRLQ